MTAKTARRCAYALLAIAAVGSGASWLCVAWECR